ncbi:MAG: response regulator transcription factor [Eubacteriales bacterium]|nr:response regulator transcription factor [Eubacteriales bacterium]
MFKILVAEDDPSTNRLFCAILRRAGYEPVSAADGEEALQKLEEHQIDLLLCDVMMPKLDGFALTRAIRDGGSLLPILMVTAKALPEDRRRGFLVGTDDYITKPVDKEEMILRIRALLRRARIVDERRITIGDAVLEYDTHTVRRGHEVMTLPPKEFQLLYKLLAYPERTFTRLQLLDEIWGMNSESDERTVNVHINRLRSRFYDWPEFEIQTVRGLGYRALRKADPDAQ